MEIATTITAALTIYAFGVVTPGPAFVLITRESLVNGRLHGAAAAAGTTASVVVYAFATLLGLIALFEAFPFVAFFVQVVGAAYLIYLGVQCLISTACAPASAPSTTASSAAGNDTSRESGPTVHAFTKAFLIGLGNPKVAIFFFGLFATAIGPEATTYQRVLLLVGVVLIDLAYHQVLAFSFATETARSTIARIGRVVDAFLGALLVALGVKILADAIWARSATT
ncbi:MAG: LysE family translocator [Pseudomonadota bacterium]